jgi:hypothetical protein
MTISRYTRRQALGFIGAGFIVPRAFAASRRPRAADPSAPYQVPGGRIGFHRPQGIAPTTNGWILQSGDHTFQVRVQETLFAPGAANPLWDRDASATLAGTPQFAGFSARRFKDVRFLQNLDYGHDSIVLADEGWVGDVSVSISNLSDQAETVGMTAQASDKEGAGDKEASGGFRLASGPVAQAGLVARWKEATDLVLGSVAVRPAPTADVAMAEFGIRLDASGLNARFAGDKLILSGQPPRSIAEVLGNGISHIALPGVSNLDYIEEDANAELFEFFSMTGAELAGGACRGIQGEERRLADGRYVTGVRVFGKRRQQEMTAIYAAAERAATLDALNRAFKSLRYIDEV